MDELKSSEYLRLILEKSTEAILALDDRGMIEFCNDAVGKLFGYKPHELLGEHFTVLIGEHNHQDQSVGTHIYGLDTVPVDLKYLGELTGKKKDASLFPMSMSFTELQFGGRKVFSGVVHELSDK